jgi:hypothetical protein
MDKLKICYSNLQNLSNQIYLTYIADIEISKYLRNHAVML